MKVEREWVDKIIAAIDRAKPDPNDFAVKGFSFDDLMKLRVLLLDAAQRKD
jgi:hypothetical protein